MPHTQSPQRKICVFSGKRGGFGAYVPFMNLVSDDPELELQIFLSDMHASRAFGYTADEARAMYPDTTIEVVDMGTGANDSPVRRAENLGTCLQKCARILEHLDPDIIVVHGDRGEHLEIALAALHLGLPVAHSQGGDVTGNIDDILRHAITKLAHVHFPETADAAERITKMGEDDWRIHTIGSLYIDRIVKKLYTPWKTVKEKYGLADDEQYFIVIFHPDTFETKETNRKHMEAILSAVPGTGKRAFVIYPCSDPGYEGILEAIDGVKGNTRFLTHKNIDNLDFLALMERAEALIGNSSCALIEASYFKLPAINIGNRQMGRGREENVVDVQPIKEDIAAAFECVRTDSAYRNTLSKCGYRLGDGTASERMLAVLKNLDIDKRLLQKRMTY